MSEQSPQPPASAPTKPWYQRWWVWVIAAALVVGGIGALIDPKGDTTPSAAPRPTQTAPAEPTPSAAPAQPDVEVIYAKNEAINDFIVAFNEAHPTEALTAGDLTVYFHHGREHEDQVLTQISGAEVVISEDHLSRGSFGVSIVWDNPAPATADGNRAMFQKLMEVAAPDLSEADLEARWQQLLAGPTVRWDDGTEATPGPTNAKFEPGTFSYVKLYG